MSLVLVLLLVGGAAVWLAGVTGSDSRKVRRELRGSKRIALADHTGGQRAKVVGTVIAIETLTAPITRRPCVFYQIAVEEYRESKDMDGNDTSGWSNILLRHEGVPFLIADGTDRAHIDPEGARIAVLHDRHIGDGNDPDPEGWGPAFLARHGSSPHGKRLRYSEGILEEGETVAVSGLGTRVPDPSPPTGERGYRDAPPTILHMTSGAEHPLLVSDRPDTLD